jgi:hypothetical protein
MLCPFVRRITLSAFCITIMVAVNIPVLQAQSPKDTKPAVQTHGPFQFSCKGGTRFSITFFNSEEEYTARIRVNGAPPETITQSLPAGSASVYSNPHWTFYEWKDEVTLTDGTRKPAVELPCQKVSAPAARKSGAKSSRPSQTSRQQ